MKEVTIKTRSLSEGIRQAWSPFDLDNYHWNTYLSSPMQNYQNIPEMAALEVRQEEILRQLDELKKQMDSIRNTLKVANHAPFPTVILKPKQETVRQSTIFAQ